MGYYHKPSKKPVKQKYQPGVFVNTQNHCFVGFIWPVLGSKDIYEVELHNEGWTCTCQGFWGHQHCKHIRAIDELLGSDEPNDTKFRIPVTTSNS